MKKKSFLYIYGGFDGKHPLGNLLELHLDNMNCVAAKLWMEMDDSNISSAVGTKGLTPLPRYGNCIVGHKGIITVLMGSASTYLNDVVQFDTNDEDEDE